MNVTEYTYLINEPDLINENQTLALEKVLDEFPYFQSARALRLKGLYNQNSYKYNYALKVTAAHTTDRTVLFDFITSETFTAIQKKLYDEKMLELFDIKVVDSELITEEVKLKTSSNTIENSILSSINKASQTDNKAPQTNPEENTETVEEKLAIGKPLDFSKSEKHSFQEWLQISTIHPIERDQETETNANEILLDEEKKKKAELIDKFIETSPKIVPVKQSSSSTTNFDLNTEDNSYLMTETLARVYLEQKKYQKAIQAYEILILKYPEKSSFFADHISEIKILQNNNN